MSIPLTVVHCFHAEEFVSITVLTFSGLFFQMVDGATLVGLVIPSAVVVVLAIAIVALVISIELAVTIILVVASVAVISLVLVVLVAVGIPIGFGSSLMPIEAWITCLLVVR